MTKLKISQLLAATVLLASAVVAHAQTITTRTNVTTTTVTNGNIITITTVTTIIKTNAAITTATAANDGRTHSVVTTNAGPWKSSVAFGLTVERGNTDTILTSATASTEKKWLQNDLTFGADGLYGETKAPGAAKNTENAETLHGFSQYNRSFWDGFFGYGRVDGLHDGIADIKYRVSLSPGLGYYFITNKTADLSAQIGPGYITEELGGRYESFANLRLEETFHYKINPHAKLWETVKFLPQVDRLNNYFVIAETGIENGLSKSNRLSLRTVLQDNYNNIPAVDRLKNDLRLVTSLVYNF